MIQLEIKTYKYQEIYKLIHPVVHQIDDERIVSSYVLNILNNVFNTEFELSVTLENVNKFYKMMEETVIVKQEHIDKLEKEIAMFLLRK